MIASLISASLKNKNTEYLSKMPRNVLNDSEKQAIDFILDYWRKYGDVPTKARFETEDGGRYVMYVTNHLISSPLEDLYEMCLAQKREEHFFAGVHKLEELIEAGTPISPDYVIHLGRELAELQKVDHSSVYTINRDDMYSDIVPDGLRFGYETLDKATGGLLAGEYGILVARPGVGKTMLLCFMSVKWFREGKRILWISCEMPVPAVIGRLDGIVGGFNPKILRTKEDPTLLKSYKDIVESEYSSISMAGGDIIFPNRGSITVSNLWGLISEHQPDVVVVDGIYLMRSEDGGSLSEWQKIKEVSNSLKQIALASNIPIFATSQLKRTGKEDGFSTEDIAYSDALSQDADMILAAHTRPGTNSTLIIDLLKNRNGDGLASTNLKFLFETMRCEEMRFEDELGLDDEDESIPI